MKNDIKSENKSVKVSSETKSKIVEIAKKYSWKYNTVLRVAIEELHKKMCKKGG